MLTRADYERRHAAEEKRLLQRWTFNNWVKEQLELCSVIDSPEDPTKLLRQLGKKLSVPEFEQILKKLNPDLAIKTNPSKPNYAHVIWTRRNPKTNEFEEHKVCNCENRFMPEFSLCERRETEIPWTGQNITPDTPIFSKRYQPGGEICRGWRTVLIMCIRQGAFTREACERLVGSADRPGWAKHLGKQPSAQTPF